LDLWLQASEIFCLASKRKSLEEEEEVFDFFLVSSQFTRILHKNVLHILNKASSFAG
jgi:hypothetical protein